MFAKNGHSRQLLKNFVIKYNTKMNNKNNHENSTENKDYKNLKKLLGFQTSVQKQNVSSRK